MQFDGERILFWDDTNPALGVLLSFLIPPTKFGQPTDYIRNDIPYDDRMTVAKALTLRSTMNPTGSEVLMGYFGYAECRICHQRLGTRDMFGYGFIWPEKAEHYIDTHQVWTPGCAKLLIAVRTKAATRTS